MTAFPNSAFTTTVTIANGASLSSAAAVGGKGAIVTAIIMPAAWTAAGLSFQASHDGTTWYEVIKTDGNAVEVTAPAADEWIVLPTTLIGPVPYLKVRSGTSAAPVNQLAERTLTLVSRNVAGL